MSDQEVKVQIPTEGCAAGDDIAAPLLALLRQLNLLGSEDDLANANGFSAAFRGPPDSVAIIEAGATAFSKWWAATLGVSAASVAAFIGKEWTTATDPVRSATLLGAALVLAALILALAHVVSSDVRGRAAAMVATIEGRTDLAATFTKAVEVLCAGEQPERDATIVSIAPQPVDYTAKAAESEGGWRAIAMENTTEGKDRFLLVRGDEKEWADAVNVRFLS